VTKYGLQLALLFPVLLGCDELSLEADLRWGKERQPFVFRYQSKRVQEVPADPPNPEVCELLQRLVGQSDWAVEHNERVLDLPGIGVVAPDLVFTRGRERVYLELLGYWSRDAVWKRVEMVEKGLSERIVFLVSSRLRVSEAVLDDAERAALYVSKGTPSPKKVLEKVAAVAGR
jgi:predicted nuclease of restriction endonuclease-like RecB superfamily